MQLDTDNGNIIDDPDLILTSIGQYYKNVYTSRNWKADDPQYQGFFEQENFSQITNEQSDDLAKELSMEEMEQAVREMKDGKTPVENSIPKEFYSKHWKLMKEDLFQACKLALNQGELLFS